MADLETVFGHDSHGDEPLAKCARALAEVNAFADYSGFFRPVIAVLGSKNSGKSWLCRQLVRDEEARARIASGEESTAATHKAMWIGTEIPPADGAAYVESQAARMEDLGRPYVLLDLPGYDDAGAPDREAALRAVRGAAWRVIVISSQTKEAESQLAYLRASNGTRILPVFVDHHHPRLAQEGMAEVNRVVARLRAACPLAEVEDAVIVPHVEHSPGTREENLRTAREILLAAMARFVSLDPLDSTIPARAILEKLRRDLAVDLGEFRARVAPRYAELAREERKLAADLIVRLLGDDRQLAAALRMKIRLNALGKVPGLFFPFRTFCGFFAFTAGAWDRLAFSLAGSLPSLALLAFQTTRNIRNLAETTREARKAWEDKLTGMAADELAAADAIFTRSIHASLADERCAPPVEKSVEARFQGLDLVTAGSSDLFENEVEKATRAGGILTLGFLATLAFLTLGAGPVMAVYREFLTAWRGAVSGAAEVTWKAFPMPTAGMFFTTILLVALPALVLALVAVSSAAPRRRVESAAAALKVGHKNLLENLCGSGRMRLVSAHPLREAVVRLLAFTDNK